MPLTNPFSSKGKGKQTKQPTQSKQTIPEYQHEEDSVFDHFENLSHSQQNPSSQQNPLAQPHRTDYYSQFRGQPPHPPHYNSSFSTPSNEFNPYSPYIPNVRYPQHPNRPQSSQFFSSPPHSHYQNPDYPPNYPNETFSAAAFPDAQEQHGGSGDFLSQSLPAQNTPPSRARVETEREKTMYFTPGMDILLATAFAQATDNAISGAEQKGTVFWKNLAIRYNQRALETSQETRPISSLMNRFGRMRTEMVLYRDSLEFVNRNCASGWNEVDKLIAVGDRFRQKNKAKVKNKDFRFEHVRKILETCSKFSFSTTNGDEMFRGTEEEDEPDTPRTNASEAGSNPPSSTSGSKRGSEDVSSPVRPKGNKASKAERSGKKMKGKKLDNDFVESYRQAQNAKHDEHISEFVGVFKTNVEEKNQHLARLVGIQERKLKLKEEEQARKKKRKSIK